MRDRILAWDGCLNVRDLGGLALEHGGETRFQVVVRADSIRSLSDGGWRALVGYGIRTAVDLRGPWEYEDDPPAEVPIEIVRFPMDPLEAPPSWHWPSMHEAYRALLERFPGEFAGVIRSVARSEDPLVVHCQGGKDRTGIACGLLLRLAGVGLETIAADHALSDESYAPTFRQWLDSAPDDDERARRTRIAVPAGATLAELLEELEERYGTVEGYLVEAGVSARDLERAGARLQP